MTAQPFADTGTRHTNQDAFFPNLVNDNGPVANDNNPSLEVVVFHDYYNYSLYAWEMYNIAVDN
ncbi:hypothetical protein VM98_36290, partial [Streptomyces rubellomurinus subsp. indigoferus]